MEIYGIKGGSRPPSGFVPSLVDFPKFTTKFLHIFTQKAAIHKEITQWLYIIHSKNP